MAKNSARRARASRDGETPHAGLDGATENSGSTEPAGLHAERDAILGDKVGGDKIGSQVNSEGAAVFLRAVEAQTIVGRDQITQYINYGSLPIAWPKESEQRYLQRVQAEFTAALSARNLSGTAEASWDGGFVQPLLSCRRMAAGATGGGEQRTEKTTRGTWSELVTAYPQVGVLVGDTHSGRSLLLRWIVTDLARRAEARAGSILPVYLSVSRFPFEDANGLLDAAAFTCGQQPEALRDCWYNNKRCVFLAIDDADEIPGQGRDSFMRALAQLNASRGSGHSILVSSRPGSDSASFRSALSRVFATATGSIEWIILPLDQARILQLLDAYGADPWLTTLIENNERLRWLVRHPGTLADFVRATRGLHLINPPNNLAQLYQLFVDGYLFGPAASQQQTGSFQARKRYHYGRVKQGLLAYLGFRMLAMSRPNGIEIDDTLCRELAQQLETLAATFSRTRRYMPEDWNVTDALQELFESPVVSRDAATADQFEFSSAAYRDYYAAIYLHNTGDRWQEAAKVIRESNLDDWTDALILLSGLPPKDSTNELLNDVLADEPSLAADLWLEKGTVGFSKVPDCVERAFNDRRIAVPERLDYRVHPAVPHFGRVIRDSRPEVALQAVNGLMQLGIDAIDPLLDAVETGQPLVVASAVHALFHMGPCLARARGERQRGRAERNGETELTPLVVADDRGFSFNNLGACNATLGELTLVSVPRTMQAELRANFRQTDFDLFEVPCSFELWHTPVAWFAIDYFRRLGQVDWIGLAAACDNVVRCAGLIVGKALRRGTAMGPIVEEMSQCAITYDRLGRWIASDLAMNWTLAAVPNAPPELTDASDQVYQELRLFFNRTNRGRMLAGTGDAEHAGINIDAAVNQNVRDCTEPVQAIEIEELALGANDFADLPSRSELVYEQNVGSVSQGGDLRGIHIGRIAAVPYRAAEVYALSGKLNVGACAGGAIEGIRIDTLSGWNGLRVRLELNVGNLERARVTGIAATAAADEIQPNAPT